MEQNGAAAQTADKRSKQVSFKNYASLTSCIRKIIKTYINYGSDLDTVMLMYNLKDHRKNYARQQEICASITRMFPVI